MGDTQKLEEAIGVDFKDKNLLKEAITHRSYLNERSRWPVPHNERMEYLGDAVLELAVTEELFHRYPKFPEGQLTVIRAALVNHQMLTVVAKDIDLQKFILMSRGERGDNIKAREIILANATEALIGAIYLDQGFKVAKTFVEKYFLGRADEIIKSGSYKDAKSELQEITQEKLKVTPTYEVLDESGPAHERTFRIGVYFGDKLIAEGSGSSKQEGETEAAAKALEEYRE